MDRFSICSLTSVVLILACAGCKSYDPKPLDPEKIVNSVDHARRNPSETETLTAKSNRAEAANPGVTFRDVASLMLTNGPDVINAVAAYHTALARARVETPAPNIGLQVGPQYGFGTDVTQNHVVPFGSLSISIPLGSRLSDTDALNKARAEVLRIDGLSRHRELFLELRRRFVALAVAQEIEKSRRELSKAAAESVTSSRRLVEAGQATALDVALFELERGRAIARLLEAKSMTVSALADLAALIGVHTGTIGQIDIGALPTLPSDHQSLDELRRQLVENHAGLARLRARYEEAECSLRLEISKQYPDFQIGPSIGGEPGEKSTRLGLSLGIALPIFDRNQQAIAEATQYREELRTRFEAEASKALAELERALLVAQVAKSRRKALEESVVPQAKKSIEIAREALSAGSGDVLRLLDAERSYREVRIEALDAQLAERQAWIDLELSVGKPLLSFAGETSINPPDGLESELEPGKDFESAGEGEGK